MELTTLRLTFPATVYQAIRNYIKETICHGLSIHDFCILKPCHMPCIGDNSNSYCTV